ncbi:MAG: hypothetical protein WCT12_35035, partial [Verrucomicrobiota bacterium]
RSAIQASGIVVCDRNSQAQSTFLGSPFRWSLRSASLQPIRSSPSITNCRRATSSPPPGWVGAFR